ncbi:MAG: porin [candidate division KSB1 bacterium]|nr:porin [candidate division KSB1 bacterium]
MKYILNLGLFITLVIVTALPIQSAEILNNKDTELNLGGRIQSYGVMELIPDEISDYPRILLFVRDTRLRLDGRYNNMNYELEVMLGGEADNLINRPNRGDAASQPITALLMDAWGEFSLTENLALRAGQFKVPYSRENLTEGADLQFTNRSINHRALNVGRDTGVMLHGSKDNKFAAFALLTGGGINQRVRYIPVKMGFPMTVLRLGYNTLDSNPLEVKEFYPEKEGVAVYANALYVKDTNVGHGSVLSMRQHESSYILSGWNPYLSGEYGETLTQFGADVAVQKKASGSLLSLGAEFNYGTYEGDAGSTSMSAATARAGLMVNDWLQLGARFSMFTPDEEIAFLDNKGVQIFAPAVTCHFNENLKLKMDLPIMLNAPLAKEEGLGYYNLIYQTGQTYLPVERNTAITGRMILQFAF